MNLYSALF